MAGSNATAGSCSEPRGIAVVMPEILLGGPCVGICCIPVFSLIGEQSEISREEERWDGGGGELLWELFSNLSPSCNYRHKHAHTDHLFEPGSNLFKQ
jgi:hypothetical protein